MVELTHRGLGDVLLGALPEDVVGACGLIDELQGELHPSELEAVAAAGTARQAEFRAGRRAARQALARLGCSDQPIRIGEDREPIWPSGYTGSISHCRTLCAAIVARTCDHTGLGLDIEPSADLDPDLIDQICRPPELAAGVSFTFAAGVRLHRPKLLFVIKEAVFKAYFPQTRHYLDFHDVTVTLHPPSRSFIAHLCNACPPIATSRTVTGRFDLISDHLLAVASIPGSHRAMSIVADLRP
jgi:4'-phosphopantetheinyl transferase EntD